MIKKQDFLTHPFTERNISKFKSEMIIAGSFDALMFQKKALKRKSGMKYICLYSNIDEYRKIFLTGEYSNLKSSFDTEVPYLFWGKLNKILLEVKQKKI